MATHDVRYDAVKVLVVQEQWRTINISEMTRNLHLPRPDHPLTSLGAYSGG
jgi:hypothetical protein